MMSENQIQLRNQVWSPNSCYAWTQNYLTITIYIYIFQILQYFILEFSKIG
ncbi:unnamed protein product [Paramecium octaurelia]|uniref:Uncharacterized protein n=1 Tax=Paramecium octaurelia TaxID=43137 RepID=A0A8S1SS49_PAROT|nr:unnamed protein product [Paramecium octaurelia]